MAYKKEVVVYNSLVKEQNLLNSWTNAFLNSDDMGVFYRLLPQRWSQVNNDVYSGILSRKAAAKISPLLVARVLAQRWCRWHELLDITEVPVQKTVSITPQSPFWGDKEGIQAKVRIGKLTKTIRRLIGSECIGFYLLGSYATRDFIRNFSDLDAYLILGKKALETPEVLLKIRKTLISLWPDLLLIDPLQHHGFFLVGEYDLKFYPETFMPLPVIQKAATQFGSKRLLFHTRSSNEKAFDNLEKLVLNISERTQELHHCSNIYHVKYYLHLLLLLPAAYLHAIGNPVYKRNSFHMVCQRFPFFADLIRKIEDTRMNWPPLWKRTSPIVRLGRHLLNGHKLRLLCLLRLRQSSFSGRQLFDSFTRSQIIQMAQTLLEEARNAAVNRSQRPLA